jgi:hypothetical protein
MSSSEPPAGGPAGRLPGDPVGDPVVLPTALNDSSSDLGDSVDALERNIDAEERNQNKLQQVRAQAAEKAAHLREQAAEKAPQVRAQAVEKAQQIRVRAAEKAPIVQANRGKAVGAFAFVLLVLWLRRRRSRRSSRAGDVGAVALNQRARSVVGDTVNALSAEIASTGRAQDKAQEVRGRAAMAQQDPCPGRREGTAGPCPGRREGTAVGPGGPAASASSRTAAGALPPDSGHGVVDYATSGSVATCCCS